METAAVRAGPVGGRKGLGGSQRPIGIGLLQAPMSLEAGRGKKASAPKPGLQGYLAHEKAPPP